MQGSTTHWCLRVFHKCIIYHHTTLNVLRRYHKSDSKLVSSQKTSQYLEMGKDSRDRKDSKSLAKPINTTQPSGEIDNELLTQVATIANGGFAPTPTTYFHYKLTTRLV